MLGHCIISEFENTLDQIMMRLTQKHPPPVRMRPRKRESDPLSLPA